METAKTVPHYIDVTQPGPFFLQGYGGHWTESFARGQRGPTLGEAIEDARRLKSKYGFSFVWLRDGRGKVAWSIDMDSLPPSRR